MAARNARLRDAIYEEAAKAISPAVMEAAKAASAIRGMNNIDQRLRRLTAKWFGKRTCPKRRCWPLAAIRIASVIHAIAVVLDAEAPAAS